MPEFTVTPQIKRQLTNVSVGDKVRVNAAGDVRVTTPKTKAELIKKEYGHLLGNELTLTEAAKKYGVPRGTISSWVYYTNYLEAVDPDAYPKKFSEAEIAYLVNIYKERRKTGSKAPLIDEEGLPYELKRPDVAEYRRNKRD